MDSKLEHKIKRYIIGRLPKSKIRILSLRGVSKIFKDILEIYDITEDECKIILKETLPDRYKQKIGKCVSLGKFLDSVIGYSLPKCVQDEKKYPNNIFFIKDGKCLFQVYVKFVGTDLVPLLYYNNEILIDAMLHTGCTEEDVTTYINDIFNEKTEEFPFGKVTPSLNCNELEVIQHFNIK